MLYRTDPGKESFTEEKCWITEILNTPDVANISIAQARVEPGTTTQLHQLNVDECYYVLQGVGVVEIDDRYRARVKPGDVVHIRAGFTQKITNASDQDLIFLCICHPRFDPECYTAME